jgi:hypothetical protein
MFSTARACGLALLLATAGMPAAPALAQETVSAQELAIAKNLAVMLQSARTVISSHQGLINDPKGGDKGLTGDVILAQVLEVFTKSVGIDPTAIDPASYEGRLLKAQMDSIVEVIDANQTTINAEGVAFKGLIPATFARLINEAFGRRVGTEATVKVTAPKELVRNRQSRPDAFEDAAIRDYLQDASRQKGEIHAAVDGGADALKVRIMVPEYYAPSCLSCHGGPAGEIDMTGYPKEGASEGDLGGVISIRLNAQ